MSPESGAKWAIPVAIALLALLLPPPARSATTPLPVGEAQGVRLERSGKLLVLVFTRRAEALRRQVAGRKMWFGCDDVPDRGRLGPSISGALSVEVKVPRDRRRLRLRGFDAGDHCRVWLPAETDGDGPSSRHASVSIPMTQRGAVFLDEEARAVLLGLLLDTAGALADGSSPPAFPTRDGLAEHLRARGPRWSIVALAAPGDQPPADAIGYYSDGRRHVAVSMLSASGRRLFVEIAAEDDVLHTNVGRHLFDSW